MWCSWLKQFWGDECGVVNPATYILIVTIIGLGMVAGLTAVRDSVVQELGDFGLALENLDQSYTVNCTMGTMVLMYGFVDNDAGDDVAGDPPGCIEICLPAESEGAGGGGGGGGGPLDATPE